MVMALVIGDVAIGIQADMVIQTAWYENKHFVRAKVQKGGQTCQKSGQMSYDGIKSKKNAFKSPFDMKKRTKPGIFQWFVRLLYSLNGQHQIRWQFNAFIRTYISFRDLQP